MAYLGELLLGLLLLAVVGALLWKFSVQHLNGVSRSFFAAVREWEQALGVSDRYATPWLLMLGDAEQSEPLLRGWGLSSTAKPAWFGRWWYGPDGAVLVVPTALFAHIESASVQLKLWRQLLEMLVLARANRPLDGVIWLTDLDPLTPGQDAAAAGLSARRKFIDLQQRLGLTLPVYMILAGLESQPGVSDLLDALPVTARNTPLGWTCPYAPHTAWHPDWISEALGMIQQSLANALVEIGTLRGEISADLYRLPQQLNGFNDSLQSLCDPVFQGNALGEAPRLRGIYFSATIQPDPTPVDADPFAQAALPPITPPVFTKRLWRKQIVAEQGLAQPIGRILQLRERWQQALGLGSAVIAIVWVLGMMWVWHGRSEAADQLANLLHDDQMHKPTVVDTDTARQRINSFWHLLETAPRWDLVAVVLPGSWPSSLNQQLEQELRERARGQLFAPLKAQLASQLNALIAPRPPAKLTAGGSPNDEAYRRATLILNQALTLESQNKRFAQSVQSDQHPLDDAIALANDMLGLNLQTKNLPLQKTYNDTLAAAESPLAVPLQLDSAKTQISARYFDAMRVWLDTLFASEDFSNIAGTLNTDLRALQTGQHNTLDDLDALNSTIDELRQLIALTNASWGESIGAELTPGYQAGLERARQSALIGPAAVEQVERYAENSKRTFHDRWLERGEDQQGILRQQSGGGLELQANLEKLDQGIGELLHQDFSQAALDPTTAQPSSGDGLHDLDGAKLDAALHYHDNYVAWLQQAVAELPAAYRKSLIGAARSATGQAMWQSLNSTALSDGHVAKADDPDATFNLPADKALQVLQIFTDIGDSHQAELLRGELNTRALNDLHHANAEINSLPLFRQPMDFSQWDGSRNLSLRSFREADVQALNLVLSRQFKLISDSLGESRPAIEWLDVERDHLSASDSDILDSFVDMTSELKKYNDQNPASSPMLYQQLVTKDFNDMDLSTCAKSLTSSILPLGRGNLALLARNAHDQARQRCDSLQNYYAAIAWKRLSDYFNTYLAGRFPFSRDQSAVDANPDRVREFLDLIDKNLPSAYGGLENSHSANTSSAAEFLFNLQNARAWLGPLLLRDKDGLRGLDLEVRWRTDRDEERGADQVINWSLATGPREVGYPTEVISRSTWTVGEPIRMALRWAQGSAQRPLDDPRQPALAVSDLQASWSYEGTWALLRFIRANQAINQFATQDDGDRPLALQLPLRSPVHSDSHALMFMRLSLKAIGGKLPLTLSTLPVSVPPSPFGSIYPLPVASNETQP